MRQLKPSAIIATAKSQEPRKIERELHQRFSSVRIPQTEYFRLSKTQVESAKIAINSSRNNTYRKQAPIILPPATNQGKKSAYQKQIATPLPPAPNPEPTSATSLTNTQRETIKTAIIRLPYRKTKRKKASSLACVHTLDVHHCSQQQNSRPFCLRNSISPSNPSKLFKRQQEFKTNQ